MKSKHIECKEDKEKYQGRCRKKCEEDSERNVSKKGRCRKRCKEDSERNVETGRCHKSPKIKSQYGEVVIPDGGSDGGYAGAFVGRVYDSNNYLIKDADTYFWNLDSINSRDATDSIDRDLISHLNKNWHPIEKVYSKYGYQVEFGGGGGDGWIDFFLKKQMVCPPDMKFKVYNKNYTMKFRYNSQKRERKCVSLIGDSILDNAYWNDVGKDTTAEVLRMMGISVVDRCTEEVYTDPMLYALNNNTGISVRTHYKKSRKEKGIPYEIKNSLVNPNPNDSDIWNDTLNHNRFIVLSLGGNDVALAHNMSIPNIMDKIQKVIMKLLHLTKIPSENIAYLIPYTPGTNLDKVINDGLLASGQQINSTDFYKDMVSLSKKMCKNLNIKCISLSNFSDKDKAGNLIPEPTKKGARKIAKRIFKWIEEDN